MSVKSHKKLSTKIYLMLLSLFFVGIGLLVLLKSLKPFCANSISCSQSFNLKIENGAMAEFNGQKIQAPDIGLAWQYSKKVLGEEVSTGSKHIYVDLSTQMLTAYQGDSIFMQVPISSGKWHPTPTGNFTIWEKIEATRMTGGAGADFYDLPNVPWVMFFGGSGVSDGSGFGLHGTYWHNNFGHPMSHGCVNMRIIDAEKLYFWVNLRSDSEPTQITIYGQTPT